MNDRYTQQNRILRRLAFLKKNKRLCAKAFKEQPIDKFNNHAHSHSDWKLPEGRIIIDKARADIGYSDSTASCDIFWSLLGLYNWCIKEKVI